MATPAASLQLPLAWRHGLSPTRTRVLPPSRKPVPVTARVFFDRLCATPCSCGVAAGEKKNPQSVEV